MIQEEIKKASAEYCDEEHASNYMAVELEKAFIAGAEWRINSVWHEITELPKPGKWIFILREDGTIKQIYTYDGVDKLFNTLLGYKWAYVEDLILKNEE